MTSNRSRNSSALRLCLAASGGGHVRQLLDLQPVWSRFDYFFVTEDTSLGRSLADHHPAHFVTHYALGQAKLGAPFKMIRACVKNLIQSIRIVWRERPDVVISTGAGAVFWVALLARIIGARFVLIESFARFEQPSKFGRLARPFATKKIVQAARLKEAWPEAELFDPFRILEQDRHPKRNLLFATVGATLPFPRMVEAVHHLKASGAIAEDVLIQHGDTPRPSHDVPGVSYVDTLSFEEVQAVLKEADLVLCHGGTGSLITALRAGCRVVAMPRRHRLGEHYDDHQEEITSAFAARGLIEVVLEEKDLGRALEKARSTTPTPATTDPVRLIRYLDGLLDSWTDWNSASVR